MGPVPNLAQNLGFAGAKNKDLCRFQGAAEALVCASKTRPRVARSGSARVNHAGLSSRKPRSGYPGSMYHGPRLEPTHCVSWVPALASLGRDDTRELSLSLRLRPRRETKVEVARLERILILA